MTSGRPRLYLLPGRDKRLRAGHPWIFANEVRMDEDAKAIAPGTAVTVHRVDGKALGVASFNPHALIAARLYDRDPARNIDAAFFAERVSRAVALRKKLYDAPYYRLVHADADGVPGLIVDRYGAALVCQINTAGADAERDAILDALEKVLAPEIVVLRGDERARALEGLAPLGEVAKGALAGPVEGRERDLTFLADLEGGQKTGWYYDQRDNRAFFGRLAGGARVLDLYCHTGGFALAAALGGGDAVTGIDRSERALELARAAAERNGVAAKCDWRAGEVFAALEAMGPEGARFDLVAADPPAFVKARRDLAQGLRGYRKLARLAAGVVAPGGFLLIASCSHHVSADDFAAEIARGIHSAGRTGRVIRRAGAGADHPVHPGLPESAYLKVLVLVLD